MGRQPTLTINVNQQQFQQFAASFGQFATQIRQLNRQFTQINQSLQQTNMLTRALQGSMQGLLNVTKSIGSTVAGITTHFLKWSTIIGGVTALLGMGGGLFGIERLAASILAKRRLILGLGGEYGRTQAQMIYQQALVGSPQDVMRNIRLGLSGSAEQLTPLLAMGIPFGTKMTPDEVMDKIVAKLPDLLKRGGPGKELLTARAYGLDKIFTDPLDLLRLSTEEGRKEYQERRKLVEMYKEQMKISPRAQKAWVELELQFQAAKAQLISVFGEKLADLATPIKHVSEGFTHLVQILMKSPVIQAIIAKLAKWIDALADKLKNLKEQDIAEFIKKLEGWGPTLKSFKDHMESFVHILGVVVDAIAAIWNFMRNHPILGGMLTGAVTGAGLGGAAAGPVGAGIGAVAGAAAGGAIAAATAATPADTPQQSAPPGTAQTPSGIKPVPYLKPDDYVSGIPKQSPGGDTNKPASFQERFTGVAGGGSFNWFSPSATPEIGGGFMKGAGPFNFFSPASVVGGGSKGTWSGAAKKMIPQGFKGGGSMFGPMPGYPGIEKFNKSPGPLSMENWQMNRTASLVIRNVPGSNVHLAAAGMTG